MGCAPRPVYESLGMDNAYLCTFSLCASGHVCPILERECESDTSRSPDVQLSPTRRENAAPQGSNSHRTNASTRKAAKKRLSACLDRARRGKAAKSIVFRFFQESVAHMNMVNTRNSSPKTTLLLKRYFRQTEHCDHLRAGGHPQRSANFY